MRDVALALGSNMGDSAAILQGALADLARLADLELIAVSHVFETDPVGGPEQPVYLNAVVVGRTALSGEDLLACTQDIEQAWDRVREVRWGPRTLDIDILSIDGVVCDTADLTLPHPRAHERGFV
ncbi:MAG: 2-amino-4-hydroxy-6-hydroxymethyldihydropteridine diphosphokinase, partial [Ilumatobacteraceae bacterium]